MNSSARLGRLFDASNIIRRSHDGQSVVEFALVLPLMLILLLGTLDLARIYTTMMSVESAAREAADYGTTYGAGKWLVGAPLDGTVTEMQRRACLGALQELDSAGRLRPRLDLELEAERLHGLLDGLALHTAMRPDRMSPRLIRSVLARHLDSLDPAENGR